MNDGDLDTKETGYTGAAFNMGALNEPSSNMLWITNVRHFVSLKCTYGNLM